jgi:hypothetical protein
MSEAGDPDRRPAIVVRDRGQMLAAVAAAAAARMSIWLRTAPCFAAAAGIPVVLAMLEQAGATRPRSAARPLIDCDDRLGLALAAIAAGLPHIVVHGNEDGADRTAAIAHAAGGGRVADASCRPLLDLAGLADPGPVCRAWLKR